MLSRPRGRCRAESSGSRTAYECSFPRDRSRRGERTRDARPLALRRAVARRSVPLPERAGARQRLAALGHPSSLARDPARSRSQPPTAGPTASASTPGAATTRSSTRAAISSRSRITIATSGPTASWKRSGSACRAKRSIRSPASSFSSSTRSISSTPRAGRPRRLIDVGRLVRHDSRSAELLDDRRAARRVHDGDDDAVRGCEDARLGERAAVGSRDSDAAAAADDRAGLDSRRPSRRARAPRSPARRWCAGVATTPARRSRRYSRRRRTAFISSGTWSLLGTELPAPVITPRARDLNFTNEGGVCGTTRLLKNIGGLWLLQACRRSWAASRAGLRIRRAARRPRASTTDRSSRCSIRIIADSSSRPTWCRRFPITAGRPASSCPTRRPRSRAASSRASRSSIAWCSKSLESLIGSADRGNPDRRRRLAQPSAQSVHRGRDRLHRGGRARRSDRARQHRHADAGDRRGVVARRSAPHHRTLVPGGAVRTAVRRRMGRALRTFSGLRGDDLCLTRRQPLIRPPHHHPAGRLGCSKISGMSRRRRSSKPIRSTCCGIDPI